MSEQLLSARSAEEQHVDNEFGQLTEVALCRPDHYDWAAENDIVARSRRLGARADAKAAGTQHQEMVTALREAGVTCRFLDPDPDLPMQTFTRDSGVMTPWGLLITKMARSERQGEAKAVSKLAAAHTIPVWHAIDAGPLEGGDIQILRPGEVLIGVNDVRTSNAAAHQLQNWIEAEGWNARLVHVPSHFLHLDVLFCALNAKLALCAVDILDEHDVDWLAHRFELIPVAYRDVMRMGCNVTALGDNRVLSARQHPKLNAKMRAFGLKVYDPDLEQFVLEGGSSHCLTMPLKRQAMS